MDNIGGHFSDYSNEFNRLKKSMNKFNKNDSGEIDYKQYGHLKGDLCKSVFSYASGKDTSQRDDDTKNKIGRSIAGPLERLKAHFLESKVGSKIYKAFNSEKKLKEKKGDYDSHFTLLGQAALREARTSYIESLIPEDSELLNPSEELELGQKKANKLSKKRKQLLASVISVAELQSKTPLSDENIKELTSLFSSSIKDPKADLSFFSDPHSLEISFNDDQISLPIETNENERPLIEAVKVLIQGKEMKSEEKEAFLGCFLKREIFEDKKQAQTFISELPNSMEKRKIQENDLSKALQTERLTSLSSASLSSPNSSIALENMQDISILLKANNKLSIETFLGKDWKTPQTTKNASSTPLQDALAQPGVKDLIQQEVQNMLLKRTEVSKGTKLENFIKLSTKCLLPSPEGEDSSSFVHLGESHPKSGLLVDQFCDFLNFNEQKEFFENEGNHNDWTVSSNTQKLQALQNLVAIAVLTEAGQSFTEELNSAQGFLDETLCSSKLSGKIKDKINLVVSSKMSSAFSPIKKDLTLNQKELIREFSQIYVSHLLNDKNYNNILPEISKNPTPEEIDFYKSAIDVIKTDFNRFDSTAESRLRLIIQRSDNQELKDYWNEETS